MIMLRSWRQQSGALLIEVLVAIVLVIIGMLGLMNIQGRLHESEVESYQRTQALILLNDMVNRIESNRNNADEYLTANPVGATACGTPAVGAERHVRDIAQWCLALQGAGETQSGSSIGSMIGGRGCIEQAVGPNVREYLITVTWQGLTPLTPPPASVTCAINTYNQADVGCANDRCRRYVTTLVRMANLES